MAVSSGTSNVVGIGFNPKVVGNFTGIGGSDPGFAWGLDLFATVGDGTAANDVSGLTTITGAELELDVMNTAGTINVARGGLAGVFLFGAAAGATITQAEGFRAAAPARVAGATGGTVTNAYSLYVEAPTIGATSNYSIFAEAGAPARFSDTVQIGGNLYNFNEQFTIYSGYNSPASIYLASLANGGGINFQLGWSSALFNFKNAAGATILGIDNSGIVHTVAANEATGAGTASLGANCPAATVAAPHTWEKIVTSDGSTAYFPVWK